MPVRRTASRLSARRLMSSAATIPMLALGAVALPTTAAHAEQKAWYDCSWVTTAAPQEATTVVAGMRVNWCVSGAVQQMVNDASYAGVSLQGGAWRDPSRQVELRKANCGGTDYYSVYLKPSGQCSPATAIPGRSQHQRGLAIDFSDGGRSINSSSAQYAWLSANAANYGFYNLPGEPWHWSTTGK